MLSERPELQTPAQLGLPMTQLTVRELVDRLMELEVYSLDGDLCRFITLLQKLDFLASRPNIDECGTAGALLFLEALGLRPTHEEGKGDAQADG